MANMEAAACGIPVFGPVVERTDLLRVAQKQRPALTVVSAPPGYGKSVFAAQCARAFLPDDVLWVPLYDAELADDEWMVALADALQEHRPDSDPGGVSAAASDAESGKADAVLRARGEMMRLRGRAVHLFLDGANRITDLEALERLALQLTELTSHRSTVTVTCRFLPVGEHTPHPNRSWFVTAEDLRFDAGEVEQLLAVLGEDAGGSDRAARLVRRFDGHPALTCVMLRHSRLDDDDVPQDLIWHVRRMVEGLPSEALALTYCAALLREGRATEVDECLKMAGCDPADWSLAVPSAPLFGVEYECPSAAARFRMHAVMCDVVVEGVPGRLGLENVRAVRRAATAYLADRRDFMRLQRLLMIACDEDEVVAACETWGTSILHHCGATMMEQCLRRLSAARLSESGRLLLLRAATLREAERLDEALVHASLAQRIAELNRDTPTEIGAVLLEVRLAVDSADLGAARGFLKQLGGPLRSQLNPAEECLCEAYAAGLEAYAGNSCQARMHAEAAARLLPQAIRHQHDAGWVATCISSVQGQLLGRWDLAASLVARAARWPGTSMTQRLQSRANYAVALMELGSLVEADAILVSVLADTAMAELRLLNAYALGTLADIRGTRDVEEGAELYRESQAVLAATGDQVGAVVEQPLRAMSLRAAGRKDEALAVAESALLEMVGSASESGLLRLTAEIEVAASLLALGDRWGAHRIVTRVQSEAHRLDAAMHLLCADMVAAEMVRQQGDFDAGVCILRRHVDYIATGSANWRMAMYCRAFPGLLGLLACACSSEHLPLRMLRLLPAVTLEAAVTAGGISPQDREVLRARAQPGQSTGFAQCGGDPSAPFCRVRFFGAFEVHIDGSRIEDSYWRKRKVRLLFAVLAVRRGRELPRDVILERFWPDMDEDRARRNFYVTWSGMKRALASGLTVDGPCPFAVCSGGVCRTTPEVRTDLDEFEETVDEIRAATAVDDAVSVLAAARRLAAVYVGEFLPGDVYEEWFTDVREETKHTFCDMMLVAARHAEAAGGFTEALAFLRRAGTADPWREDIYQTTMRCQIGCGQRSRAIETYLACRGRLVDDLGIDPSAETTRLYQAVLAMESDDSESCRPV
ncbi:MAG: hypothetical protein EG823_08955 [Actinobacteria bacterium]|nr:hypothetical protein [Actinomycetota bacterium]